MGKRQQKQRMTKQLKNKSPAECDKGEVKRERILSQTSLVLQKQTQSTRGKGQIGNQR
jgi:hypothetical protein